MNSKTKKLMSNTFLFMVGSIGSKFIQFLLVPLYTYALSTSDFGVTDIVFTTINFLIPFFSIQISDGLLRFGLDKNENKDSVINAAFKLLFVGSIFSVLLSPLFLLSSTLKNWIFYLIIILNLRIYRDIFSIILKIDDKNKLYALDSMVYTFVLCVSSILLLVILKLGITGYFISYVIANLFSIFFIIILSKFNLKLLFSNSDKKLVKRLFLYSAPLVINSISYWITTASDRYMVNYFADASQVGLYAVAAKIPTIITTFTSVFSQAWLISSISEVNSGKNAEYYSKVLKSYVTISFLSCSCIIFLIKPFMYIYVNHEYFVAWKSSIILILSAVFSGFCSFLNGIFYAYKKNISVTFTTLFGAVLNIVLNLLMIPKIGIIGASIATLLSWMFMYYLKRIYMKKFIIIDYFDKKMLLFTFICIIEIVCLFLFNTYISLIINFLLVIVIIILCKEFILIIFKFFKNKMKRRKA